MPKIVDKAARREEIAEKGAHRFFLEGYENTPVRAITEATGISKGSFYDCFSSKEEILGLISGLTMQLNMMKTASLDPADMPEKVREPILGGIEVQ